MKQLLINGVSTAEIQSVMQAEYGMSDDETREMVRRVGELIVSESRERAPLKKALAEQRLHRHIIQASKRNQWGAVSALEHTLARVQGTEEPVVEKIQIDHRIVAASIQMLGTMSEDEVQALIAEDLAAVATLPGSAPHAPHPRVVKPIRNRS